MRKKSEKLGLIEFLLQQHQTREARALINKLLKTDHNNPEIIYWRGVCEKLEGNLKAAEQDFRIVTRKIQNHDKAFYGLGLILEGKGDIKGAISAYQQVIAINPLHPQAQQKLAQFGIGLSQTNTASFSHRRLGLSNPVQRMPKFQTDEPKHFSKNKAFEGKFKKDFERLQKLLDQGKWKEADQKTAQIIHKILRRNTITSQDIVKFPCSELYTIDHLWTRFSQGRFGFSVQKKIYQGVGGLIAPDGYDRQTFEWFSRKVGWHTIQVAGYRKSGSALLGSKKLSYTLSAPPGHLPASWILLPNTTGVHSSGCLESLFYIILTLLGVALFGVGILLSMLIIWLIFSSAEKHEREKKTKIEKTIVMLFAQIQKCGG